MKKVLCLILCCFFASIHAMQDDSSTSEDVALGEFVVFGDNLDREQEVDMLISEFFAGDTLPDQHRDLLKKQLIASSPDEHLSIVSKIAVRRATTEKKDELVKVLFAIVSRFDEHNGLMEQQVAQLKEFNAGQEEDDKFAHEQFRFAKYSWKVGTVLGALGTIIGSGIAIWQGSEASQC